MLGVLYIGIRYLKRSAYVFLFFFNCYLTVPRSTFGHSQGDSLTNRMLITAFAHIQPEGHLEPRNEVGSLSPAERLAGFEPGTFRFLLQRLNPLGHSPQVHVFSQFYITIHCNYTRYYTASST